MLLRVIVFQCATLCFAGAAGAAEELSVEASRRDGAIEVRAHALVTAAWETVWGTLTDYDRLPAFIPGMKASRVTARNGQVAVVEQVGEARFLFFSFPIEVTVQSTARPPDAIDIRALKGSFRRLDGGYRLKQLPAGVIELVWIGLLEPDFALPPLLGEVLMRSTIEDQFLGMVREIERREALRRAGAPRN
jgi:ribosome-associated toxin RatA of RatAB toxin-antitoxin module